jgi:DNA-binding transcriptional ArsR family regulator
MNMQDIIRKDYFTAEQEQTARFAKALGHPVRIAILELLHSQSCCYHGDMAEELPIAKSTLSQHLKELKEAGLEPFYVKGFSMNISTLFIARKV